MTCVKKVSIAEDWECAICMEGVKPGKDIMLHSCGHHFFHVVCLGRNPDSRCALCRSEQPLMIEEMPVLIERSMSENNQLCAVCGDIIYINQLHLKLSRC